MIKYKKKLIIINSLNNNQETRCREYLNEFISTTKEKEHFKRVRKETCSQR